MSKVSLFYVFVVQAVIRDTAPIARVWSWVLGWVPKNFSCEIFCLGDVGVLSLRLESEKCKY
jgi:hypothetical protein